MFGMANAVLLAFAEGAQGRLRESLLRTLAHFQHPTSDPFDEARGWLALDWLTSEVAAEWLRHAGVPVAHPSGGPIREVAHVARLLTPFQVAKNVARRRIRALAAARGAEDPELCGAPARRNVPRRVQAMLDLARDGAVEALGESGCYAARLAALLGLRGVTGTAALVEVATSCALMGAMLQILENADITPLIAVNATQAAAVFERMATAGPKPSTR
jgi:hypothetical protein